MKIDEIALGALILGVACSAPAAAQEHPKADPKTKGHAHGHGGLMTKTKEFRFEVVFLSEPIRIYGYDAKMTPIDLKDVKGELRAAFKNPKRKALEAPLAPGQA